MNPDLLLSLANSFYLFGTILLIRKLIKNRNSLKDFDCAGSIVNFIGMIISATAFIEIGSYIAAMISVPTMLFWAMAAIYSFRNINDKNSDNNQ